MEKIIGLVTANYSGSNPGKIVSGRPLASIPFLGRYRLVDFALSNMVNGGIETVGIVMPVNYRSIIDHVGSGKEWGLSRKNGGLFIMPGTAFGSSRKGPRFLLRDLLNNKVLLTRSNATYVVCSSSNFVINADVKALLAAHASSRAGITALTAKARHDDADVVRFELDGHRVKRATPGVKEGEDAFLDLFVIDRELLLDLLERYEHVDHLDLFEALTNDWGLVDVEVVPFGGYYAPIFNERSYYGASVEALSPDVMAELFPVGSPIMTKAHDTAPAKYEAGSHVRNSSLSAGCRIFGTVVGSVLGRGVVVEPGAEVYDSIIMQSCVIRAGAKVSHAIVDRNNVIPANCEICGTDEDVLIIEKPTEKRS